MKSKLRKLFVLILNLVLIFSMAFSKQHVHAEDDVGVVFNDAHLEAVIRQYLDLDETEPILKDKLETLTNLDASKRNISDLTGLEYAINLEDVDLSWNFIEDYQYFNPVNMLGLDLSFNKIKVVQHIENIKILNLRHNDITDITELDNFSPDYDLTINLTENLIDFENSENLDIISQFENTSVVVLYENQHQVKTRPPFRPIILEIEKTLVGEDETVFDFEIIGMLPSFENTFASEYYYIFDEFESEPTITNNGEFNLTIQGTESEAIILYVKHPFYDTYFKTTFNLNGEFINPITGLEIQAHDATLDVEETLNLSVLIEPENASITDVIWLSSNPEKASIDNDGIVLAHQRGEVEIIAVAVDGGFEAQTMIEVIQPVTSVKINEAVATLNVGETDKLTATVSPEDANNKNVTWSSSNLEVLSVDQEGNLEALVKGEATITVTTEDGDFDDSIDIEVKLPIETFSLELEALTLNVGASEQLVLNITPKDASDSDVVWSSSDSNVVTVDQDGNLTANAKGEATITVKTINDSHSDSIHITVLKPAAEVEIIESLTSLEIHKTFKLSAKVFPEDASNQTLIWSSSHPNVIQVDDEGNLSAKSKGTATITVLIEGTDLKDEITIEVIQPVTGVEINEELTNLNVDDEFTLTATITPEDANNQNVIWSSSNLEVLSVDQEGNLHALAKGEATITVITEDGGHTNSILIEVKQPVVSVKIKETLTSLNVDDEFTLTAIITPEDANNQNVSWSSSNSDVLSINEDGLLKALKKGSATITVTTDDGGHTDNISIEVKQPVMGIEVSYDLLTLNVEDTFQLYATVLPTNANNQDVDWSSNHPEIVSVDEHGLLTAKTKGIAVISVVTVEGNYKKEVTVEVKLPIETFNLELEALTLNVGASEKLILNITPEDASDRDVVWSSSDLNVVTVDEDGILNAVSKGEATITVKTVNDSHSDSILITVLQPAAGVKINESLTSLEIDEVFQLSAKVLPEDASNQTLIWSSSHPNVIQVDDEGNLSAISKGIATITVLIEGTDFKDEITIEVIQPVSDIKINEELTNLNVGAEITLTVTITPENANNQNVTWSTSNSEVLSVDQEGNLHALAKGQATITVTTEDGGHTNSILIEVKQPVVSVKIKETLTGLNVDDEFTLTVTITPDDANNQNVVWNSSNSDVLSISEDGVLKALKKGSAIITVTTEDGGYTDSISLEIKQPVKGIEISHDAMTLNVNEVFKLTASVLPLDADNQNISWSSSHSEIVSVDDDGNVKALKRGQAVITATSQDGHFTAETSVAVIQLVTKITPNKTKLQLIEGASEQLTIKIEPQDANNKNVTWTSSNSDVVTVDAQGKIKAIKPGSAIVSVESVDRGVHAEIEVVVKQKDINLVQITNTKIENGYLTGLKFNQTILTITNQIKDKDKEATIEVFDASNKLKTSNHMIVTGDRLKVTLASGTIVEYIVAIKGDVNGDGKISASDYVLVANHLLGKKKLTKEALVAADINGDLKLSAADYVALANHLLGKKRIHE